MTRLLSILTLALVLLAGRAEADVYVSPTGNDTNAGTFAAPVQTLAQAQTLARAQGASGVNIYLRAGTYILTSTLALTNADSGEAWQPYNGEQATVSSAQPVTGWTLQGGGNNIWQASVPAGVDFRQIYVNGLRAVRVRSANSSLLSLFTNSGFSTSTGYTSTAGALSGFGNPSSIELVYNLSWIQARCPVASVTSTAVTMAQPCWGLLTSPTPPSTGGGTYTYVTNASTYYNAPGTSSTQTPAWVENAYELLSSATTGQFYLNKATSVLYYVPRAGENMASAVVTYPALQTLVSLTSASNVRFTNITFADSSWLLPNTATGFSEMQGNLYEDAVTTRTPKTTGTGTGQYFDAYKQMPGAVAISGGTSNTIDRCTFQRLGTSGLTIDSGAANTVCTGSYFTDISGNAIDVSNPFTDTVTANPVTNTLLVKNTVNGCCVEYQGGVGIASWYGKNTQIKNNLVCNLPYTGITVGWGHGDSSTIVNPTGGTVVSGNILYSVMQTLQDGSPIYTNGTSLGETDTGNVIYNCYQANGFYLDDGSDNKTITGNLMYDNGGDFNFNDTAKSNVADYNFLGSGVVHYADGGCGNIYPNAPADFISLNQYVQDGAAAIRPASILNAAGPAPKSSASPSLSIPLNLSAGALSGGSVTLSWAAPTYTGSGVSGYEIWMNGQIEAVSGGTSYTFPGLQPSTTYQFSVLARDSSGKLSLPSAPVTLTTPVNLVPNAPSETQ